MALSSALHKLVEDGVLETMPLKTCVAAISAGIVDDQLLLDLCYEEDSSAQVDLNCVMTGEGELVELQGTGEGRSFTLEEQQALVDLCIKGIKEVQAIQRAVLGGNHEVKLVLASKKPQAQGAAGHPLRPGRGGGSGVGGWAPTWTWRRRAQPLRRTRF